jgi:hypothetical protein
VRTEWFKQIDECEKFNLVELKKRVDKNLKLEDKELFKKFMFEFEVSEGNELIDLRLIAIDTYITTQKIECFQIATKVIEKDINGADLKDFAKLFVSLKKTNENVKTNFLLFL